MDGALNEEFAARVHTRFGEIESLDLRGAGVTHCVGNLSALSRLRNLVLAENALTTMGGFSGLDGLTCLNLADNEIESIDTKVADEMPMLETLDLSRNRIRDKEQLKALSPLRSLRELRLEGNPVGSASGSGDDTDTRAQELMVCVAETLPQLEILDGLQIARPVASADAGTSSAEASKHEDSKDEKENEQRQTMETSTATAKHPLQTDDVPRQVGDHDDGGTCDASLDNDDVELRDMDVEIEKRVTDAIAAAAERRIRVAEERASAAELRADEAERRADEAELQAQEADLRADEAIQRAQEAVLVAENAFRDAETNRIEADGARAQVARMKAYIASAPRQDPDPLMTRDAHKADVDTSAAAGMELMQRKQRALEAVMSTMEAEMSRFEERRSARNPSTMTSAPPPAAALLARWREKVYTLLVADATRRETMMQCERTMRETADRAAADRKLGAEQLEAARLDAAIARRELETVRCHAEAASEERDAARDALAKAAAFITSCVPALEAKLGACVTRLDGMGSRVHFAEERVRVAGELHDAALTHAASSMKTGAAKKALPGHRQWQTSGSSIDEGDFSTGEDDGGKLAGNGLRASLSKEVERLQDERRALISRLGACPRPFEERITLLEQDVAIAEADAMRWRQRAEAEAGAKEKLVAREKAIASLRRDRVRLIAAVRRAEAALAIPEKPEPPSPFPSSSIPGEAIEAVDNDDDDVGASAVPDAELQAILENLRSSSDNDDIGGMSDADLAAKLDALRDLRTRMAAEDIDTTHRGDL